MRFATAFAQICHHVGAPQPPAQPLPEALVGLRHLAAIDGLVSVHEVGEFGHQLGVGLGGPHRVVEGVPVGGHVDHARRDRRTRHVLAQITGDLSLLREDLVPDASPAMRAAGGYAPAQIEAAKELAFETLKRFRDGGNAPVDDLSDAHLRALLASLPQTLVIATHDLGMVRDLDPRVVVIDGGRVVADGSATEILADDELLVSHGLEPLPHGSETHA